MDRITPWPHDPAVLARVEEYPGDAFAQGLPPAVSYYEVRYANRVSEVADHDAAVRTAEDLKHRNGRAP